MKFQPLLAGTLLLAPTLALAQSNQAPTPAEIFSQGAQYTNVKISPSGDYLSVIMNHEGKDKLLILNTEDLSAKHIVYFPGNAKWAVIPGSTMNVSWSPRNTSRAGMIARSTMVS